TSPVLSSHGPLGVVGWQSMVVRCFTSASSAAALVLTGTACVRAPASLADGTATTTGRGTTEMPRRPATITQADIARAVRAFKQGGAVEVELNLEDRKIIGRFASSQSTREQVALEAEQEICL